MSDYSVKLNSEIIKKRKITPWVENFSSCILFWPSLLSMANDNFGKVYNMGASKKVMLILEILVPCRGSFGNKKVQQNKHTHVRT